MLSLWLGFLRAFFLQRIHTLVQFNDNQRQLFDLFQQAGVHFGQFDAFFGYFPGRRNIRQKKIPFCLVQND